MHIHDVIIIGGGASGLMCGIHAARKNLDVLLLEKGSKVGLKILISGGGRCNFTNLWTDPRKHYLSENPHFCISALRRYEPSQFIEMVKSHNIAFHEKKYGQLFCDHSAKEIVNMLLAEAEVAGLKIKTNTEVAAVQKQADSTFITRTADKVFHSRKIVIASGGLSIPKIASDLAFRIANALNINVIPPRAALVPFTWNSGDKAKYASLSGISLDAEVQCGKTRFRENILFTHRGLSGPAILQISSYWSAGESVYINLMPDENITDWFAQQQQLNPQQRIAPLLKKRLPKRFIDNITGSWFEDIKIGSCSPKQLQKVAKKFNHWEFRPGGTEGYRTAEVTLGGIDTSELSSKTFEFKKVPGLYAIGEAIDVTGWLGGYNFQWAWASAYSCALFL